MNLPLSILLPVRNVQTTLHSIVHKLIDILPELTQQFELLIVDDGSTDATCEVAYELARDYPQIQVTRHAVALGWATAVTRQAALARGEFIMIHGGGSLETDDLVGLWRLRQGVAAAAIAKARAVQSGKSWRIDLHTFPDNRPHDDPKSRGDHSSALGIHARAPRSNLLMVHRQQIGQLKRSLALMHNPGWPANPRNTRRHSADGLKPPTFLSRLKEFTLGE